MKKLRFMYKKPDELPQERRIVQIHRDATHIYGIDTEKLTGQEKNDLDVAIQILDGLNHARRTFLIERIDSEIQEL
jgi:hypothetical protein